MYLHVYIHLFLRFVLVFLCLKAHGSHLTHHFILSVKTIINVQLNISEEISCLLDSVLTSNNR